MNSAWYSFFVVLLSALQQFSSACIYPFLVFSFLGLRIVDRWTTHLNDIPERNTMKWNPIHVKWWNNNGNICSKYLCTVLLIHRYASSPNFCQIIRNIQTFSKHLDYLDPISSIHMSRSLYLKCESPLSRLEIYKIFCYFLSYVHGILFIL